MPLPIDLVLVRHGESEGNIAARRDRAGDSSLLTPEHQARPPAEYRLTDQGIKQAKAAGLWLRKNIPGRFDFFVTSAFVRARETAGYLGLAGAEWEIDPYLVERDHGEMSRMSHAERVERYGEDYRTAVVDNFYHRLPSGESRLDISLRWDRMMLSLSQRHADHRVIIVAHETIIESGLIRRLHWTIEQFHEWKKINDPTTKIHNCQIIHFSRRDPETGQVIDKIRWYRSVCPWNLKLTPGQWQKIDKRFFTNQDLLDQADRYPRLINP